jgi:hypothetical protein
MNKFSEIILGILLTEKGVKIILKVGIGKFEGKKKKKIYSQ